jgi:hypothetical protein
MMRSGARAESAMRWQKYLMGKARFVAVSLIVFSLFASFATPASRAQGPSTESIPNHPALSDRFTFELGAYYSKSDTDASLGPAGGGTGVSVNFEDTLGLDHRNWIGIGGFLWRFSERWRIEVEYFKLQRDATRVLTTDVTWGDRIFPAGSTVDSTYDFSDIRVSTGYSFFKRRDKEIGAGFGFHVARIKASLQTTGGSVEASDVRAPLPVLNLYGVLALTDEWAARVRFDWLSLNYGAYSGDLKSSSVDVLYRPFRSVGFGLGVRTLVMNVDIDATDWRGKARTSFAGPVAFMTVSF